MMSKKHALLYFPRDKEFVVLSIKISEDQLCSEKVMVDVMYDGVMEKAIVVQVAQDEEDLDAALAFCRQVKREKKLPIEKILPLVSRVYRGGRQIFAPLKKIQTDVESGCEQGPKKKQTSHRSMPDEDDSEEDTETDGNVSLLPPPVPLQNSTPTQSFNSSAGWTPQLKQKAHPAPNNEMPCGSRHEQMRFPPNADMKLASLRRQVEGSLGINSATNEGLATLMYMLMRQLADIRARLNVMEQGSSATLPGTPSVDFRPIESDEQYADLCERLLNEEDFESRLIQHLSKVGGNTTGEAVRRALRRLVGNKMESRFNRTGVLGKISFSEKLEPIVKVAVAKIIPTASEKEVEMLIRSFFKDANKRSNCTSGERPSKRRRISISDSD